MDQVSNFFESILTVDVANADGTVSNSNSKEASQDDCEFSKQSADQKTIENGADKNNKEVDATKNKTKGIKKSNTETSLSNKKDWAEEPKNSNTLLVDRFMEMVLSMIVPKDIKGKNAISERVIDQKSRPPLSVNLISRNSILLNSRLSVPFKFLDSVINFGNWKNPFLTIGILLIYTHAILNPYLFLSIPLLYLLNEVMIPHLLVRYPTDKPENGYEWLGNRIPNLCDNVPIHEYTIPGPVSEFSYEFILNLTDLQNHMMLYVMTYDFLIWLTRDYLYFKDENTSSLVYLLILGLLTFNWLLAPKVLPFIIAHAPIKLLLIILGWAAVISFHPKIRGKILDWIYSEETRINFVKLDSKIEECLLKYIVRIEEEDGEREPRPTEIFELQLYNSALKSWVPIGFLNDFYSINSPQRKILENSISAPSDDGEIKADFSSIQKVASLGDIKPPKGWKFVDSPWFPDLEVEKWVNDSLIQDVVGIDSDEKWVYDYDSSDIKLHLRRKKWVRYCIRSEKLETKEETSHSSYTDFLY